MAFNKPLPVWNEPGVEVPSAIKNSGWGAGIKPPAPYFNNLHHKTYEALKELQEKAAETAEVQEISKNLTETDERLTEQLDQVAIGNIEQSTRLQAYEHARIIDNKQSFRQGIVTISNNSQSVGGWFKSAASFATVAFGGSGQVDTNYTIALDVVSGDKSAIGDLRVHDRTLNGFKIGYSGSAKNATIAWALINKEGAKL